MGLTTEVYSQATTFGDNPQVFPTARRHCQYGAKLCASYEMKAEGFNYPNLKYLIQNFLKTLDKQ
jgi:hypothetical protein